MLGVWWLSVIMEFSLKEDKKVVSEKIRLLS